MTLRANKDGKPFMHLTGYEITRESFITAFVDAHPHSWCARAVEVWDDLHKNSDAQFDGMFDIDEDPPTDGAP